MAELSIRQDKFAREYVKTGNGALAARKAGYSSKSGADTVQSVRLLANASVSREIKAHRRRMQERLDVSRETLVNNTAHIAEQAAIKEEFGAAINATALIMKAQGYLVEKSMSLNVDVTQQHLDALQSYTDRRIDEALAARDKHNTAEVEASAIPFTDIESVSQSGTDSVMDVMSNATHADATDNADVANPLTSLDDPAPEPQEIEAPRMR